MFVLPRWMDRSSGWNDPLSPQSGEQVQERTEGWLVLVEAGQAALGHVGHDLDLAPEVQVGVPGRRELAEVWLGEAVPRRDLGPDRTRVRQLRLQRRRAARVRDGLNPEVGR